ncbi:MAG: hypothetical protein V2B17_06175, partial [Chloroflexota bacterium]
MRRGPTVGRGRRVIALTTFLVALALAGCGAPPGASPLATATPGASAIPSGPAPSPTPLPPGSFTFDLPPGWAAVPVAGSHDGLLATLRSQNAAFAESLAARLENLSDTTTYVAFDASPAAVTKGDLATLVVTEVALPLDVSLQTFAGTIRGQVRQLVEGDVELREILVTAGQAYSMAYTAPVTRPDGQPAAAAVTQVLYVLPGRGYVITFAVPPARANDYSQVVADIATSF